MSTGRSCRAAGACLFGWLSASGHLDGPGGEPPSPARLFEPRRSDKHARTNREPCPARPRAPPSYHRSRATAVRLRTDRYPVKIATCFTDRANKPPGARDARPPRTSRNSHAASRALEYRTPDIPPPTGRPAGLSVRGCGFERRRLATRSRVR